MNHPFHPPLRTAPMGMDGMIVVMVDEGSGRAGLVVLGVGVVVVAEGCLLLLALWLIVPCCLSANFFFSISSCEFSMGFQLKGKKKLKLGNKGKRFLIHQILNVHKKKKRTHHFLDALESSFVHRGRFAIIQPIWRLDQHHVEHDDGLFVPTDR